MVKKQSEMFAGNTKIGVARNGKMGEKMEAKDRGKSTLGRKRIKTIADLMLHGSVEGCAWTFTMSD